MVRPSMTILFFHRNQILFESLGNNCVTIGYFSGAVSGQAYLKSGCQDFPSRKSDLYTSGFKLKIVLSLFSTHFTPNIFWNCSPTQEMFKVRDFSLQSFRVNNEFLQTLHITFHKSDYLPPMIRLVTHK